MEKTYTKEQSSFIAKVSYNNGTIIVENHNGTRTAYGGSMDLYERFIKAHSPGKFWHEFVKPLNGHKI